MMAWTHGKKAIQSPRSQSEGLAFIDDDVGKDELDHCTDGVSFERKGVDEEEMQGLLHSSRQTSWHSQRERTYRYALIVLGITNTILLLWTVALSLNLSQKHKTCDSLQIYSPANSAVEYEEKHFTAALFTKTPYMGFPSDETDRRWEELYNFGISKISKDEAKLLHTPTLPIPGTEDYLVQLDVWHQLHCLNDLRKLLYPERYPGMAEMTTDGKIDRADIMFMHWEHCVDAIRQSLMCHADVAPIPFHVNVPVKSGVFPRLATTHTCKNFEKIQEWGRVHTVEYYDYNITSAQGDDIIKASGFDNSPEEDIEFMWPAFPGNKFFKHWREHSVSTSESRR